jgi:hypothetical protein
MTHSQNYQRAVLDLEDDPVIANAYRYPPIQLSLNFTAYRRGSCA